MTYRIGETHDSKLMSWVESANDLQTGFPIQNLPLGVIRPGHIGVAIGDQILDLQAGAPAAMDRAARQRCLWRLPRQGAGASRRHRGGQGRLRSRPGSRGLGLIDERSRVLTLAQRDVDCGVVSLAQYLSSLAPRYKVARNGTTSPPPPS